MILATKNPTRQSRWVERVTNKRFCTLGYRRYGLDIKVISFSVDGQDGRRYQIELDEHDLQQLFKARYETYKENFEQP